MHFGLLRRSVYAQKLPSPHRSKSFPLENHHFKSQTHSNIYRLSAHKFLSFPFKGWGTLIGARVSYPSVFNPRSFHKLLRPQTRTMKPRCGPRDPPVKLLSSLSLPFSEPIFVLIPKLLFRSERSKNDVDLENLIYMRLWVTLIS